MREVSYEMRNYGGKIIFSDLECGFTRLEM